MELSDVAQNLWKRYNLPWQNNPGRAREWEAKSFAQGIITPYRKLEFTGQQGRNFVNSLKYLEFGYGIDGGYGGISVYDGGSIPAIYYEITPSVQRDFAERLGKSGPTGEQLRDTKAYPQTGGTILSGLTISSLSILEPFLVNFIESRPLPDQASAR